MKRLNPPAGAARIDRGITGTAAAVGANAPLSAGAATARTSNPRPAVQPRSRVRHEPAGSELPPFDPAGWDVASDEYVAQLLATMEALLDLSDCSRREVGRILSAHGCTFDVSRLLSGGVSLRVRQLLDLCRAMGVHPLEVLRPVLKEPRRTSALVERSVVLFGGTDQPRLLVPARAEEASPLTAIEERLDRLERWVDEVELRGSGVSIGDVRDSETAAVGAEGGSFGEELEQLADTVRRLRILAAAATPPPTRRGPDGSSFGEDLELLANTVRRLRMHAASPTAPAPQRSRRS